MLKIGVLPICQKRFQVAACGCCQLEQCGQGENPPTQVHADGLAQATGVTDQVQDIVDELECHAEIAAELTESIEVLLRQSGSKRSNPTRAGEKGGSLGFDGEQIPVNRLREIKKMLGLRRLSDAQETDRSGDIRSYPLTGRSRFRSGSRHQVRAGQESLVLTFHSVDRRRTPSSRGVIEDVVVDKGADLHELDGHSSGDHTRIERVANIGHGDGQSWTKTLSTAGDDAETGLGQVWRSNRACRSKSITHHLQMVKEFG
jgi:hypothetical protein